jgi:succinoglycan biosynthesis transport protein ExoP
MPLRPNMGPDDFLEILRRRRWWIVFSTLIILFGAIVYCVLVPDLYRSTTKILIIPPAVAEGVVQSNLNLSTKDRMQYIEQEVLGGARLEVIANEMGLFRDGSKDMTDEERARLMRSHITLDIDKNNSNVYILSFDYGIPQVSRQVTSRLVSSFIQENIKGREETVQETSSFLDTQLEETRKRLERQEERIKEYKIRYGGELPQQEQSNLNRLQRLQDQIKNNSDSIARLQDRKVFMETQISTLERNIAAAENQNPWEYMDSGSTAGPNSLLSELAMRKKQLEELSQKYTPLHPSVVQARWEVKQLEDKIAKLRQEARKKKDKGTVPGAGSSSPQYSNEPQETSLERAEVQRLRGQVASIDLDIQALKRESANTARTIDDIQRKVERLPQREQEMVSLSRDYDNLKKSYDELLEKKLKANISKNLEVHKKGERFQVLEPANLPTRPSSPNRLKILALALMVSVAFGVGGPIGFEILDPRLRGSKDFKNFFELPILATLPVIHDARYRRKAATRKAMVIGGLVSILGAYVVFLAIYGGKVKLIVKSIASTIGG